MDAPFSAEQGQFFDARYGPNQRSGKAAQLLIELRGVLIIAIVADGVVARTEIVVLLNDCLLYTSTPSRRE